MPSQWLAAGAETDPLTRARQLQRSWERLLAEGALGPELPPEATAGLRPAIVESWRRSLATGLDPTELVVPIESDQAEARERWLEHPLGSLEHVIAAQLRVMAEESESLVVVTDASGLLLHIDGAEWLKERAREMNFLEGARLSEAVDGTNGIGTALAADHALQVFAFEHFNQRHHQWICSGAPVHDPLSGRIVGLIDLSSLWEIAHPRSLELVTTAARTMEQCLLDTRRDQDARLRRRYGDLMTRSTDVLVNRDGYLLDGDEPAYPTPFEIPEGGGEIVLDDGSVAVAEPLGQGEAYLVRRASRRAKSAPVEVLERAEQRARELADEQAALRQVATLVARESSPHRLFAVVAEQVARVFDVPLVRLVRYEPDGWEVVGGFSEADDEPFPIRSRWPLDSPDVIASVWQTSRPARVDDYANMPGQVAAAVRRAGMRSAVASPIVVEGHLWGAMVLLCPRREPLPANTEARLTDFTELVATAIANAESRIAVGRLAEEQAALRRVATLVAQAPASEELFSAVAHEVATVLNVPGVIVTRYEADGMAVVFGDAFESELSGAEAFFGVGSRAPADPGSLAAQVLETHGTARVDDFSTLEGTVGDLAGAAGFGSGCAAPIVVNGELWGKMCVFSGTGTVLPARTEERLYDFIELVATAISNYEARAELAASEARALELANEQAALRRVATLAARESSRLEVLEAVAKEAARVLEVDAIGMLRFDPDGTATLVAQSETLWDPPPLGTCFTLEGENIVASVHRTGQAARMDDWESATGSVAAMANVLGVRSAVASPIVVEGQLWGTMVAATNRSKPLPADTEARIVDFTELLATAIANADSRAELAASEARARELAHEQAALRRVATLVAQGASPDAVFTAVAEEVAGIINTPIVAVFRYESDGTFTTVGVAGETSFAVGSRWPVEEGGISGMILASGRPARKDDYSTMGGPVGEAVREALIVATVGVPIVVEGSIWGFMVAGGRPDRPLPTDTEERLARFTELVATAVSNATMRGELVASRARVLAAADDARRRIERDLHDGAQQQLVTLALAMRSAEGRIPTGQEHLKAEVGGFADRATSLGEELREMSRGIHPAILSEGGLSPALEALALRSAVPVKLNVRHEQRLPDAVEVAAYYVASEALTNVSKHADASLVELDLHLDDASLRLSIRDDGRGGADPSRGSGLLGLKDRVEALGGTIDIESPHGTGTRLRVAIPVRADSSAG